MNKFIIFFMTLTAFINQNTIDNIENSDNEPDQEFPMVDHLYD
jgi:hypothetical protein